MLLEGKSAVVTGSSKGIGRAFAMGLAQEGAKVVVNGTSAEDVKRTAEEIRAKGGEAVACVESVATMAGAQRLIQAALDHFGRLDILVNNAGLVRDRTLLNMTEAEWDEVMAVHLKGTFACGKYAALAMRDQNQGRIINITSHAAFRGNYGQSNYAAAKAGVLGLTLSWAAELAQFNITVNAVWPRAITRMTEPLLERRLAAAREAAAKAGRIAPELIDLGFGPPEIVAPLVVFLASDDAQSITGRIFSLTGHKLAFWSLHQEAKSAIMPGGWTVEGVRRYFWRTVASEL